MTPNLSAVAIEAYRRIDGLLEARARDYPRRVEPTWSELVAALEKLAAHLRARVAGAAAAEIESLLESPVFVVGHRKSGTSLLLNLLDGHPQLAVLASESGYFTDFLPRHSRLDRAAQLDELHAQWIHRLVNPAGFPPFWTLGRPWEAAADPYERFTRLLYGLADRHPERDLLGLVAGAFAGALDLREARFWVEKTPGHEHHVDRILAAYPRARVVHVLRDPRAIAAALTRLDAASGYEPDLLGVSAGVRASFEAAGANTRRLGEERYLVVRYEDLVSDPEAVMRRVAVFVGIDFAEALLTPTVGGAAATANSAWAERRVRGEIESSRLDKWREELDEPAVRVVSAVTRGAAQPWGYDLPAAGRARALAALTARRARRAMSSLRRP